MNVRNFSHGFVNIGIAPLIVTNAVLSTLCKSLPMNRNAECFHECFLDVVSCQVTFWSMTSLNATHVTLHWVLRVQNFIKDPIAIRSLISCSVLAFKPCSFSWSSQDLMSTKSFSWNVHILSMLKSRECSTPFLRQTMSN